MRANKAAPTVMLVDHHCHLDFPDFAQDLDGVVGRARAAGVVAMVTISTRVGRFGDIARIAEAYPGVFCSVGTHPHHAHEELHVPVAEIVRLSRHPKVVAIGEAGLDYFYAKSPRPAQAKGFRAHIAAAQDTGLPLVIHARDADEDVAAILEEEMAKTRFGAVLHCFTGGAELATRALALGLYISFSGILTFKRSQLLREVAASVPLDRLLVETDAPYLAPGKHRGKRNEPAFVVETAAALAAVKGIEPAELARMTTENFLRLYSKTPREAIAP
jgi:TatD DNase family protein